MRSFANTVLRAYQTKTAAWHVCQLGYQSGQSNFESDHVSRHLVEYFGKEAEEKTTHSGTTSAKPCCVKYAYRSHKNLNNLKATESGSLLKGAGGPLPNPQHLGTLSLAISHTTGRTGEHCLRGKQWETLSCT